VAIRLVHGVRFTHPFLAKRSSLLLYSDPTGFSLHGDFQNGWDITALQNAIDQCNNSNDETGSGVTEACEYLTVIDASVAGTCKTTPVFSEQVGGALDALPG